MIYLDYAAASPLSKVAFDAMQPYFSEQFFNPSAPYLPAKRVSEAYNDAKNRLAHTIGAKGNDLVMTAGATESINLAFSVRPAHALILSTEHASVRESAKNLAESYDEIKVDRYGLVNLDDLRAKIRPETTLISIALANNELGTIQPFAKIATIVKEERQNRLKSHNQNPLYLHSDASQALNLLDVNVARLGVDLLTINAAKVYGPKGIGALYVAHGIYLRPVTFGGGQESGLRSGTENVPATIGFAVAAEFAKDHLKSQTKKYRDLKRIFCEIIEEKSTIKPLFLGNIKHQLANFVSVSFPGIDAERLIFKLEDQEIYVSTGAACAASKGEKSRVLQAIGLTDKEIAGSIRISMGSDNDEAQIRTAAAAIAQAVNEEAERIGL